MTPTNMQHGGRVAQEIIITERLRNLQCTTQVLIKPRNTKKNGNFVASFKTLSPSPDPKPQRQPYVS